MASDLDAQVTFEKHKIFLYKEDFSKFLEGLEEVVEFIKKEQGEASPRETYESDDETTKSAETTNTSEEAETKKSFFKFKF